MPNSIIPTLKYENTAEMIEWLGDAFGFEKHVVVTGDNGRIDHAQLLLNGDMIMLSSSGDSDFDQHQKTPQSVGGVGTQSPYVLIDDVDAHCARATAAGAEMVMEPADQPYGGRLYSCKDPEGHLWSFGSYDPWQEHQAD